MRADPDSLEERASTDARTTQASSPSRSSGQWTGGDSPPPLPSLGMYTGWTEPSSPIVQTSFARRQATCSRRSRHVRQSIQYRNVSCSSVSTSTGTRRCQRSRILTLFQCYDQNACRRRASSAVQTAVQRAYGSVVDDYALITGQPNVSGEHAVIRCVSSSRGGSRRRVRHDRNHLAVLGPRLAPTLRQTRREIL